MATAFVAFLQRLPFLTIVEADFLFIDALCYIPLANAMLVLVFLDLYQNPDLAFFPVARVSRDFTSDVLCIQDNQGVVHTSILLVP